LHRRVAELLGERAPEDRKSLSLEIAWHFLRGGDVERALQYGLVGAEEALQVGAPYEAEQVLSALHDRLGPQASGRFLLIFAKALLDQSKASAAMPILAELGSNQHALSPRDTAEGIRLQACALYLVNSDSTIQYCETAQKALQAAQETGDQELVGRALLECAKSGAEAGDAATIQAAERELENMLGNPFTNGVHSAWYARGYCHYVRYDLAAAAACVRKTIELLCGSPDYVALLQAHNALGACHYYSCEFTHGQDSLSAALKLAKRMGDDFRYSSTASNLCSLHILQGNYAEAVRLGRLSLDVGLATPNQPHLMSSYTNLAEAYMLSGERERAHSCLEAARQWMEGRRSWRATMDFTCESANIALMNGNLALALQFIDTTEAIARGRERAVPEGGMFHKLRIFRAEHVTGGDEPLAMAERAQETFRGRHMVYFLEVLAARAWLEKRRFGRYSRTTEGELRLFDSTSAHGLRNSLAAQGFLT